MHTWLASIEIEEKKCGCGICVCVKRGKWRRANIITGAVKCWKVAINMYTHVDFHKEPEQIYIAQAQQNRNSSSCSHRRKKD